MWRKLKTVNMASTCFIIDLYCMNRRKIQCQNCGIEERETERGRERAKEMGWNSICTKGKAMNSSQRYSNTQSNQNRPSFLSFYFHSCLTKHMCIRFTRFLHEMIRIKLNFSLLTFHCDIDGKRSKKRKNWNK